MPRISQAWKNYSKSERYFEDLSTQKISVDPVAKRQAVKAYKKDTGRLPSVKGDLPTMRKTSVNTKKDIKTKTGLKNGDQTTDNGNGVKLQDFKWIFPPFGLLPDDKDNVSGDPPDLGDLGQWIFPPLGMLPGGSGQQAIDTGKASVEKFDTTKMLLIGGSVLGGIILLKGLFK